MPIISNLLRIFGKKKPEYNPAMLPENEQMRVMNDRFDALLKRMDNSGVASRTALVGCSDIEIALLEKKYSLRLPYSYHRYLEIMGHKSGLLFRHDHMAVTYEYVVETTDEERARLAEEIPEHRVELPPTAFFIASRLGDQFEYIVCDNEEDSPVWYYAEWDAVAQQSHSSILAWLEAWCDSAERAIASGYFNKYPNGTSP